MRNAWSGLFGVALALCAAMPLQAAEPNTGELPPALLGRDRQGDVVDLAGVPRLADEADLGAGLLADQVVVQGRSRQ